jgi:hypothetical protein|tara:strand:- start:325 stop:1008 length:684 start_codon:yes stop_codon:yes gene_type:complete
MFTGPKIITDGLALTLDATNPKSWTVGGSTWYDISGNDNHATVNGSPATQNTGTSFQNVYFDGSNDYLQITANETSLSFKTGQTVGMWVYHPGNSGRRVLWDQAYGGYGTWTHEGGGTISYYYGSNGGNGQSYKGFGSMDVPENGWNYITSTRYTGGAKWYLNGSLERTTTDSYTPMTNTTTNNIRIGLGYTGVYFQGNIAMVHAYTRGLSDVEVSQNYNALKLRFI